MTTPDCDRFVWVRRGCVRRGPDRVVRRERRDSRLLPPIRCDPTGPSIDILPALKREDSSVGRRAVPSAPEGNFLTSRGGTGFVRYTSALETRGWRIRRPRGTGIRLCRTRYRLNRGVRMPGNRPRLERERTRVVPSTILRRRGRSATANGACFGVLSLPRLRGRCRPSPVTGRGTVRTADEPQQRTPHRLPVVGVEPSVSAGSDPESSC